MAWRIRTEWMGGLKRNQWANRNGIIWRFTTEYALLAFIIVIYTISDNLRLNNDLKKISYKANLVSTIYNQNTRLQGNLYQLAATWMDEAQELADDSKQKLLANLKKLRKLDPKALPVNQEKLIVQFYDLVNEAVVMSLYCCKFRA